MIHPRHLSFSKLMEDFKILYFNDIKIGDYFYGLSSGKLYKKTYRTASFLRIDDNWSSSFFNDDTFVFDCTKRKGEIDFDFSRYL